MDAREVRKQDSYVFNAKNRAIEQLEESQVNFSDYYYNYLTRPVYERLTDSAYFGGTSKERFDEFGYGRGL